VSEQGKVQVRRPYVCPVCDGKGIVPNSYYSYSTVSTAANDEPCRSCFGTGVIWG
jgi:DnaJ-class molecular chaperone